MCTMPRNWPMFSQSPRHSTWACALRWDMQKLSNKEESLCAVSRSCTKPVQTSSRVYKDVRCPWIYIYFQSSLLLKLVLEEYRCTIYRVFASTSVMASIYKPRMSFTNSDTTWDCYKELLMHLMLYRIFLEFLAGLFPFVFVTLNRERTERNSNLSDTSPQGKHVRIKVYLITKNTS